MQKNYVKKILRGIRMTVADTILAVALALAYVYVVWVFSEEDDDV